MIEIEKTEKNKLPIMGNRQRLDLTEWVIHFVHDRKPMDNPSGFYEDYIMCHYEFEENSDVNTSDQQLLTEDDFRLPDYYDEDGNGHFIHSLYIENEYKGNKILTRYF